MHRSLARALLVASLCLFALPTISAQRIPHNQDKPPGPALSPEEARTSMKLPEGFAISAFAHEPDVVNPIKMCFDERGRIWMVESLEYPRSSAGPGRDRIKILEDTDRDGVVDEVKIFADGLNIPCGIAVGHGGVWVTNSPDILFIEDLDGDDRADKTTVVLTGFGRHDTHELPNTLTWGPDGWLYGLNGVFNPAKIVHEGRTYEFTCALWRLHPRTLDFELFAEGTSNPWGMAFDREGSAFVEACVIDHLYHLVETGYYHRQAGRYPPFTWKIESIVEHKHYKAAYCGMDIYDADVYPERFRERIFFGNIHGACVNSDSLTRRGSTYFGEGAETLVSTEDAWFMPVDVRLGPDGCFWVLDWYDRYHCYQDARRDPEGIDRLKGRLWRITYGASPMPEPFDLAKESSTQLIERLAHPNRWWRQTARRVLAARRDPTSYALLERIVLDRQAPRVQRMEALWTLVGIESPGEAPVAMDERFHLRVLMLQDPGLRAWGVRAAGDIRQIAPSVRSRVLALVSDQSADVRLQVAIAARKLQSGAHAVRTLLEVLRHSAQDPLIPRIVWRNLEPLVESEGEALAAWLGERGPAALGAVEVILARVVERVLARQSKDPAPLVALVELLLADRERHSGPARECLIALRNAVVNGELEPSTQSTVAREVGPDVAAILDSDRESALWLPAATLAAGLRVPRGVELCREVVASADLDERARSEALRALAASASPAFLEVASELLTGRRRASKELRGAVISELGRLDTPEVSDILLGALDSLDGELQTRSLDVLTQRSAWAATLLDAIASGKIEASRLNAAQARRILALGDESLAARVRETWGSLRTERDPGREQVIERMMDVLAKEPGDPWKGKAVFEKTCAQCHKIFGNGNVVGPDLTDNGRGTLTNLMSNLLDPNLVVSKNYYTHTVVTTTGRALSGLLVESSPQRVVLRVAGGRDEVIPHREVARLDVAPVSLMPEKLEETLKDDEFRDLIEFLRYDEAPPTPVEVEVLPRGAQADRHAVIADASHYGAVRVSARFPGSRIPTELLVYRHSEDQRPYVHPLRAPRGGPVLTALRPDDHPWQYGVFTGHSRVNGIDFWTEKGWIRSRGLESVTQSEAGVEIVAKSDWLDQRRGGKRVLSERQRVLVPAPTSPDAYAVDIEWTLVPEVDIEFGRYDYGGLAFRPAAHEERRHEKPTDALRRPWQDMSGVFGTGDDRRPAGVAIFDHPDNPGFPSAWRVDGQGLINPALSMLGPLRVAAGEALVFRYRLLVHDGHGRRGRLDAAYQLWAPNAERRLERLEEERRRSERAGLPRGPEHELHAAIARERLPQFELLTVGEGGIRILGDLRGRESVLQSHPFSQEVPCVFERELEVPARGKTVLRIGATHHDNGDWRLVVRAGEEVLTRQMVSKSTVRDGWLDLEVDLSRFAGRRIRLRVANEANDWSYEYGFWSHLEVITR